MLSKSNIYVNTGSKFVEAINLSHSFIYISIDALFGKSASNCTLLRYFTCIPGIKCKIA